MSSDSKKKEPRYTCLSEAKASHSQRMWAEVSSSAAHLLHSGLSDSPIRWRCLLRVLCPMQRPVTALDCVLLKDRNLALAPGQGPEISSRACLSVSQRLSWRHASDIIDIRSPQGANCDSDQYIIRIKYRPKIFHAIKTLTFYKSEI